MPILTQAQVLAASRKLDQLRPRTPTTLASLTAEVLPGFSSEDPPPGPRSRDFGLPAWKRPPLAELPRPFTDPRISPSARRFLRGADRVNRTMERRAAARGLYVPDEHDEGGWINFLELIDNINRPQSAIFNVWRGMQQGLPMKDILENAIQGFTFEERTYFADLLEGMGMDHPSRLRTILGFAGDVALEPINFIPAGAIIAPFKIAATNARRIKVINALTEAVGVSVPMKRLRQVFITSTGNKILDGMKDMSVSLDRATEVKLFARVETLDRKFRRKLGKLYERVAPLAERPGTLSSFSKARKAIRKATGHSITEEEYTTLKAAVKEFRSIVDETAEIERAYGIKDVKLTDKIYKEIRLAEQKEARALAKRTGKILKGKERKAAKLRREIEERLKNAPLEIREEFADFILGRLRETRLGPLFPDVREETISVAEKGVKGFVSKSTGKIKLGFEKAVRAGTNFVKGNIGAEIAELNKEIDEIARLGRFVEFIFPEEAKLLEPFALPPKLLRGKRAQKMHGQMLATLERIREGKFASMGKPSGIVGTGKPARTLAEQTASLHKRLSARQVKRRLREAIDAYASGAVSENQLGRWLSLFVGPGSVELKHFTSIISRIKARRALVEKLAKAEGPALDSIEFITESLINGTFTAQELLGLFKTPALAKKTGLAALIREMGKRMDDVQFALRGAREGVPAPVAAKVGALGLEEVITRPVFHSLFEVSDHVSDVLQHYVRGDFEIDELVDLLGATGVPGRKTLRGALQKIKNRTAAIDELDNLSKGRIQAAEESLARRYGPRIQKLRALIPRVPAYIAHILTAEGIDNIVTAGGSILRKLHSDEHVSLLWRRFVEKGLVPLDLDETQAILMQGEKAFLHGRPLFKKESFFETFRRVMKGDPQEAGRLFSVDPKVILGTRALRAANAIGEAKFLDDVAETFGTKIPAAVERKGARALEKGGQLELELTAGKVRATPNRIKDYVFDPDIADEVNRVWKSAYGTDEGVNSVIRAIDEMTNYWKVWTLGIFPAYHFRNQIGNLWNMHLGGMFEGRNFRASLRSMQDAAQLQRWAAQGNVDALRRFKVTLADGATVDGNRFLKMLHEYGIIDQGFYSVESGGRFVGDPTANLGSLPFIRFFNNQPLLPTKGELGEFAKRFVGARGFRQSIFGPEGALTRTGVLYGRAVENQYKAAFFLHQIRDEGLSNIEAMQKVAKFLFNYRDITQAEHVIKKFIPFYTWTRKNLPLQLEQLVRQPQKFARIPELGRLATGLISPEFDPNGDMPPEEDIPRYIRESSPVPIRRNKDGTLDFWVFRNWLPAADIDEFLTLNRLQRTAFSMMHPVPKVLLETAFGKSLYFDSELTGQGEFWGRQMDRRLINAIRSLSRFANEFDAADPFGGFHKTRDAQTPLSRIMRAFSGLRTHAVSPEYERLRRVAKRNELLRRTLGRDERNRRMQMLKLQGLLEK